MTDFRLRMFDRRRGIFHDVTLCESLNKNDVSAEKASLSLRRSNTARTFIPFRMNCDAVSRLLTQTQFENDVLDKKDVKLDCTHERGTSWMYPR